MSFTTAGIRVWDSTEAASIHGASFALANSINTRIVGSFADTAARDAAFSALSSSQKAGIHAWVVNRQGLSYWDATSGDWEWVGVNRVIYRGNRASAAEGTGNNLVIPIFDDTPVTLPPGNRMIDIVASSICTNINNTNLEKYPELYFTFSHRDARFLGAGNTRTVLRFNASVVASGSLTPYLAGINTVAGDVRFSSSSLTLIDRGPTDS